MIGSRTIEYELRRSARATRTRIEVTPEGVDVIAPEGLPLGEVERFVESKRRWIHDKTEEIREAVERWGGPTPQGYHSGAKVLFRGRRLKLRVEAAEVDEPSLNYRTAFHLQVPPGLSAEERERAARDLIEGWLEERLVEDAWEVVRRRGEPHGLEPRGIRVKDQQTLWGSCGRDGVLRLDRRLVRLPKPVFEYVLVHELCHLRHRNHSADFWGLVKRVLPDYEERKAWLQTHEVALR